MCKHRSEYYQHVDEASRHVNLEPDPHPDREPVDLHAHNEMSDDDPVASSDENNSDREVGYCIYLVLTEVV